MANELLHYSYCEKQMKWTSCEYLHKIHFFYIFFLHKIHFLFICILVSWEFNFVGILQQQLFRHELLALINCSKLKLYLFWNKWCYMYNNNRCGPYTHMKLLKPLFGYQTLCIFRCFYFLQKQLFNHSFWSTIFFFAMCCVQQFFLIKVLMKFLENIFACGLYASVIIFIVNMNTH